MILQPLTEKEEIIGIDIPIVYDKITFEEGLRLDVLVEDLVIVELKAVEES